ncbi:MAG: hypothetical protein JWM74_615, partial [Myxococcaceae bacterium]|nr:hypothetical protein [Myxococcaceae bacterium]
ASHPAASSSSTLTTPPPLTPLTPVFRNVH